MTKKFYFLLIFVFAISALLLGLSYSKDSGDDSDLKLIQNYDKYFRVVFSNDKSLNEENNKIDFGITNITEEKQTYIIKLSNNDNSKKIYYKLDGEEEMLLNKEVIFTSTLNSIGTDGDYVLHSLEVKGDENFVVDINVGVLDNSLKTCIKESDGVFVDTSGNYRYFGDNVNNYIKVNNVIYRMVGLFESKIRVISDATDLVTYNENNNYLTVEDYILSFDKHDLKEEDLLGNKSWLNIDFRYWLHSNDEITAKLVDSDVGVITDSKYKVHYQRVVKEFGSDAQVIKGNGSLTNPYEVSYGS